MIARALRQIARAASEVAANTAREVHAEAIKNEHEARATLDNARALLLEIEDKKAVLAAWQKYRDALADLPRKTAARLEAYSRLPPKARRPF